MSKYTPPSQPRIFQLFDVACLIVAIFTALWLPLRAGWAGVSKEIDKIDNPTWETLKQTPAQVEQWVKLGYADAASAHDVIQNHFHYSIDWLQLVIMAVVVLGYFLFLFMASEREYRDVIEEKFGKK